ncbi:MAG TPA: hypothetical protein PKU86_05780, partial [Bacteroidales bacterium]|nr:hypothetical protein [Bacteroidales bacterium]
MKQLKFLIILIAISISANPVKAQTYDTIKNIQDHLSLKQGYWEESINRQMEKGWYIDNKREGIWRTYYPQNILHEVIEYKDG